MGLPKTWITNELLTSAALNAQFVYVNSLVPVGTILPFDDHDGTVTFDTDIFAYCNGQTISDAASPLNGKVITDMSNRYLVGFGTEAGGDIGTVAWSATIKGNASHQANLQHLHAETVHTHAHSHTHDSGTLQFKTANSAAAGGITFYLYMYESTGTDTIIEQHVAYDKNQGVDRNTKLVPSVNKQFYTKDGSGSTGGASSTNTSNNAASNTGNGLSTTQSIQPRSRQVRYIERYK